MAGSERSSGERLVDRGHCTCGGVGYGQHVNGCGALASRFPCMVLGCETDPVVISRDVVLCSLHARQWVESGFPFKFWITEGRLDPYA